MRPDKVMALNRARDRLDAARADALAFNVMGYRVTPIMAGQRWAVHDRHGTFLGRFMPDGRFVRRSSKQSAAELQALAAAFRMLAAAIDGEGEALPAVALNVETAAPMSERWPDAQS